MPELDEKQRSPKRINLSRISFWLSVAAGAAVAVLLIMLWMTDDIEVWHTRPVMILQTVLRMQVPIM